MEDYVTITTNEQGKQVVEIHTDKDLPNGMPKSFVMEGKIQWK